MASMEPRQLSVETQLRHQFKHNILLLQWSHVNSAWKPLPLYDQVIAAIELQWSHVNSAWKPETAKAAGRI